MASTAVKIDSDIVAQAKTYGEAESRSATMGKAKLLGLDKAQPEDELATMPHHIKIVFDEPTKIIREFVN